MGATYIISILARGARGTTGTHGTLEEIGEEKVRITRIREKRRGRLRLEEGGKEDSRWGWSVYIFVEGVCICIEYKLGGTY